MAATRNSCSRSAAWPLIFIVFEPFDVPPESFHRLIGTYLQFLLGTVHRRGILGAAQVQGIDDSRPIRRVTDGRRHDGLDSGAKRTIRQKKRPSPEIADVLLTGLLRAAFDQGTECPEMVGIAFQEVAYFPLRCPRLGHLDPAAALLERQLGPVGRFSFLVAL